ncbi:MAG: VCBS repeat-containing protein [Proteobacteria bacterium]|nr:VCBS repeat-containing protein [Pseudomonadota bacterium]MBU1389261.1 VCBS repeat-containing protein [Pseudomonadota bacterium]MBU1544081.1 VCBS repeat-containing protein [Pseudomonadota bacterium]MBU2482087.1 VCBS repeat-containing protein [Pseudomonadota bacterium]
MLENYIRKSVAVILFCAFAIPVFVLSGHCETEKKVAVCPFQMNAAQDLSFLQKGLFSMLSSRLADPGKVMILDRETIDAMLAKAQAAPETKGPLNASKAKLIGRALGVDYVLFGNVTMFGQSVSLDTTMVDVSANTPDLTFSRQAEQPGAVITELDLIATQINQEVFNRKPEVFVPQAAQQAQAPSGRPQSEYRDSYASPLTNHRVLFAANGEIIGMSCGDVDGDKKNEVVIVYPHAIEILKYTENGRLVPVKKIQDAKYIQIISVDVADINGNGMDEIFITRVHGDSGLAKSYVLENQGNAYKDISGNLPWYLRVVKANGKHPILYAQESGKKGPYNSSNVFRVNAAGGKFTPGEKLKVPAGFSVMSMTAVTDAAGTVSGRLFTEQDGRLTIFNTAGAVEWSGEKGYGGTRLYYEFKEIDHITHGTAEGKGVFFQPRNLVYDVGADGTMDVIAIKNTEAAGNFFGKIRNYKGAEVETLAWSEVGLSSDHAPRKMSGQVTDIAVGDYDNSSKQSLMVAFIKKYDNFSSQDTKSMIVAYDME